MIINPNNFEETVNNLKELADEMLNGQNLKPWNIEVEVVRWDAKFTFYFGTPKEDKGLVFYTRGDSLILFISEVTSIYLQIRRRYEKLMEGKDV